MKAYLVLEDGTVYGGIARGAFRETPFEAVFNTSVVGYVEILTDPAYAKQGIVMTYPIIGNYGVCTADFESDKLQPAALLVHELCGTPSNFRSEMTIEALLVQQNIPCVSDLDSRAIVTHLRENGTMRAIITADISDMDAVLAKIKAFEPKGLVEEVTAAKTEVLCKGEGAKIALLDLGMRRNLAEALKASGCTVTRYPAGTSAETLLADSPDAVLLTNGPGNPEDCAAITAEVKKLFDKNIPMFGVGLGHQLIALACGGKIEKMSYGHRGTNQPVKFLKNDKTYLTSQNHGYAVSADGVPANAEVLCTNVNDQTIEGLKYPGKPVFSVQFHPEIGRSPRGTTFLFEQFLKMTAEGRYDD